MSFIKKVKAFFYIAKTVRINKKVKTTYLRRASDQEISAHLTSKNELDMAVMTCTNPSCNGTIQVTRKQKFMFLVTYPLRYKRFVRIYCCQECQRNHTKQLVEEGTPLEMKYPYFPSIEDFENELQLLVENN